MRRPVLKWCGAAVLGSFIVHCSKRRTLSMLETGGGSSNQYLLSITLRDIEAVCRSSWGTKGLD